MYFWSLDMTQPKVAIQANTLSHTTVCSILASKRINKNYSTRIIGGLCISCKSAGVYFTKKNTGRRFAKSPYIVGGIYYAKSEVFIMETRIVI
jgi:hypothetical protein